MRSLKCYVSSQCTFLFACSFGTCLIYNFIDIKQTAVGSRERAWALPCVVAQAAASATTAVKLRTL